VILRPRKRNESNALRTYGNQCPSPVNVSPRTALSEVDRIRRYQHADTRRDCDHDPAAVTARKASCKVASSPPGGMRTVAAPITISIADELPEWLGAIGTAARDRDLSKTTGVKATRLSAVRTRCASRRQANNCVSPCRRATALTLSPGFHSVSAMKVGRRTAYIALSAHCPWREA
jgi:hypothetical protein